MHGGSDDSVLPGGACVVVNMVCVVRDVSCVVLANVWLHATQSIIRGE